MLGICAWDTVMEATMKRVLGEGIGRRRALVKPPWRILALASLISLAAAGCGEGPERRLDVIQADGHQVIVKLADHPITVDTTNLSVRGRVLLSDAAPTPLGAPTRVVVNSAGAHWYYPKIDLNVQVALRGGRVVFDLTSGIDQTLAWPVTGAGMSDLQIPVGEGLNIPADDPFWAGPEPQLVGGEGIDVPDLSLPLWSFGHGSVGASYLVPTDIGTTLQLTSVAGRIQGTAKHKFISAKGRGGYSVMIRETDGSPLAGAEDYRELLRANNGLTSLRDKISRNPDVAKLIGAYHAYNFGAASKALVKKLQALGVSRMWLGYDEGSWPADSVSAAKSAGYLVGPYDSYANVQDPAQADSPLSIWPGDLWPDGCIIDERGNRQPGFHDRGCYLSSQALAQRPRLLDQRVAAMTSNGANSYFLDVDATGATFDDYSLVHPMSQAQDRRNRLARMRGLDERFVVGSEAVEPWANDVVDFSHGSSTPALAPLWDAERDRRYWGGYTGQNGADIFFRKVDLTPVLHTVLFDPKYRIPMYEAVLHDSVVSLDRWELPFNKFPAEQPTRTLLSMLYVTPLLYALDMETLNSEGFQLARLQQFFASLASNAGIEPLTGFTWLTGDHLVQQTSFGDDTLSVTANFGSSDYHDASLGTVKAGCVIARARDTDQRWSLCA